MGPAADAPRPGAPGKISAEAYCQIMAIACQPPENFGRPITHWTERELADLRSSSEPLRFESIDEAYSDSDMAFADGQADVLEQLGDAELRGQVAEAIGALPERLQLVVQLYFLEELNLAEIAGVLEVSVPRVHQLKAQALDHLRKALAGVADIL